jgi:hypothetical protein
VQFGEKGDTQWEILDLSPPTSYLKPLDTQNHIIELMSCYAFPNEKTPDVFIYPADGLWKLEKKGIAHDLTHGEEYRYVENKVLEDTMDNGYVVNNAYFQFILSSDEEHIQVKIIIQNQELDLGERVHNYILLALARKRLLDVRMGCVFGDQGWIATDELLSDMSKEFGKELDTYYLNLKIYRLRKLLMETKPYGYLFSNIIERRQGEIRFLHRYFQILKEDECIGEVLAIAD